MGLPVRKMMLGIAVAATMTGVAYAQPGANSSPASALDETSPLTASRMFQILAADVAMQRGEYDVAAKIYLELALNLKDARLARRLRAHHAQRAETGKSQRVLDVWLEPVERLQPTVRIVTPIA